MTTNINPNLNVNPQVQPWPISGTVVVSNVVTTNATITNPTVIQGNSTGAPWVVSGTIIDNSTVAINTAIGAQTDAQTTGDGSVISILKRIRTLLTSGTGITPVTKYVTYNNAQGNATVWAPTSGTRVSLETLFLSTDVANVVTFDGSTQGTFNKGSYVADGGFNITAPDKDLPIFRGLINEVVRVSSTGSGNIYVTATGFES